jgi:lipoprotein NlpD
LNFISRYLYLSLFALLLTGCSSRALNWNNGYHTVQAGETLYSIAVSYNLNYQDLARWNRLGDATLIREGQRLRLTAPAAGAGSAENSRAARTAPVAVAPPRWYWPTDGTIYLRFGESPKTGSGIRVTGAEGQPVRAVAAGQVVYAGSGLASYGQLLIIKHNDSWLSAYGFNRSLLVAEGQNVAAGQSIAQMGKDAAGRPVLHFEIRKNGQPVDPLRYLPAR